MKKTTTLFVSLIVVLIGTSIQWIICENVLTCNISLNDARRDLLSWLVIADADGGNQNKDIYIGHDSPLYNIIGSGFKASYDEAIKSDQFCIILKRDYYMGGYGSETVTFEVIPVDVGRVRIKVDYLDYGTAFFPPYIFWNPGLLIERKILRILEGFVSKRNFEND